MNSKLETYLSKAIENIVHDRQEAKKLLDSVEEYIEESGGIELQQTPNGDTVESSRHKAVGAVAAKYVEALQRSNDQLIRVIQIVEKNEKNEMDDVNLDDESFKDKLYSIINEEKSNG